MARSAIPGPLQRRHLIERELSEAQALRVAEAYRAVGREVEAIEFLVKAKAAEGLDALRQSAVESGDAFLLRALARATDEAPSREQWLALASAAEAAGKELYAIEARLQADRSEG